MDATPNKWAKHSDEQLDLILELAESAGQQTLAEANRHFDAAAEIRAEILRRTVKAHAGLD